jgi:hypothetical protein
MIVGGLFALFFLASFATPTPGISQPADRQAVDRSPRCRQARWSGASATNSIICRH